LPLHEPISATSQTIPYEPQPSPFTNQLKVGPITKERSHHKGAPGPFSNEKNELDEPKACLFTNQTCLLHEPNQAKTLIWGKHKPFL